MELDESAGRETEGASRRTNYTDELVVLGGGDVMQALMRALDKHLTALLDDGAQNRRPELRVVDGALLREMSAGGRGIDDADATADATDSGRMMRVNGSEKRGDVGGDFEEDERRSDGVDGAQAELMEIRRAQLHGDVHQPLHVLAVRRVLGVFRLRAVIVHAPRQRLQRQHADAEAG